MSQYEDFVISIEPKTMAVLAQLIWDQHKNEDFVIETELMNLANEMRARLEKITLGITVIAPAKEEDWLSL